MPNQSFTHQSVPKVGNIILHHHRIAGKNTYWTTQQGLTQVLIQLHINYIFCVWVILSPKKLKLKSLDLCSGLLPDYGE